MALRRLSFHRVLYRPILLRHGERKPVLLVLCSAGLLASRMETTCLIAAAAIMAFGLPVCRYLAKKDPYFLEVFIRSNRYRTHYPPRSRPYRENPDPNGRRKTWLWSVALTVAGLAALWNFA